MTSSHYYTRLSFICTISSPIRVNQLHLTFQLQQSRVSFFITNNTHTQKMVSKVCLTDPSKLRLKWHLQDLKDILLRTSFPKLINNLSCNMCKTWAGRMRSNLILKLFLASYINLPADQREPWIRSSKVPICII